MQIESFSYKFNGKVWNMLVNEENKWLIIEIRQHEIKRVSFWVLDLDKNHWIWEDVEFEEAWWLNLLHTAEDKVFLNYFPDQANPDNKKIIVVDVAKLKVIEELPSFDIQNVHIDNTTLISPLHYVEGSDNFNTVRNFIQKQQNHEIIKAVDYLERSDAIYISYYFLENEKMDNLLLVMKSDGNVLVNEKIGSGMESIGLATFFLYNEQLITVKNKQEIIIYQCE